ncbi:LUD domain-containing protein [Nocardioides sp. HDW12B]|nr:LUD domain-containing protein [Nocardioides sp. HDW12B]
MPVFPTAARAALADTQLRRNLAHATSTIRAKRLSVVSEVEEWEDLRLAGAAIKDQALLDLDQHLLRLEERLTANGAIVHWARDAAEACAIVAQVARDHEVDEVVKVKSMATAEIELNERLAEHGIAAWETDLAELIVQLGDDLPSHILVPAIHRNRAEIREIFLTRMAGAGKAAPADLTDDPPELAAAARQHLREKFLRAKVGISGANFAVADTGTLVVVESEGNGRMCLTLPEVLVSVVGIEKVLPTWTDLEVFLQTLPRSSTGERMNPYTSTWSGVTPGDGPQEVHVVLLDNGRTRALADEVGRQALRCIRCSACLNVCPVYERTGGHAYGSVYPGPIGAILNPLLRGPGSGDQVDSLPYASTLCGACFEACPVRIDIPTVLVDLRAQVVDAHRGGVPSAQSVAMKGAAWTFGSGARLRAATRASGLLGDVVRRFGRRSLPGGRSALGRLPGPGAAWSGARDMPTPPSESFRAWWRRTAGGTSETSGARDPEGGPGTPRPNPGTPTTTGDRSPDQSADPSGRPAAGPLDRGVGGGAL